MKKIIFSSMAFAVLAILGSSCQKPEAGGQIEGPAAEGAKVIISATAESGTKATEADNIFLWSAGDKIALSTGVTGTLTSGEGTPGATFDASATTAVKYAVYPASAHNNGIITYPDTYNGYVSGQVLSPMIAEVGEALVEGNTVKYKDVYFYHLGGLMEINFDGNMPAGADRMVFTSTGEGKNITGVYTLTDNYDAGEIATTCSLQGNTVTFNFTAIENDGESMKFFVPVPAGAVLGNFKVDLYKGETAVASKEYAAKNGEYTIERAKILRNLTGGPQLEFAEDYSGYVYNWMAGPSTTDWDGILKVKTNIGYTVSSDREWAGVSINEEGDIKVSLDYNYAPGPRKFTLTLTPTDQDLKFLEKSITLTEDSDWQRVEGSGFTLDEETGVATIISETAKTANIYTYYVEVDYPNADGTPGTHRKKGRKFIWEFSEFNITSGRFHVEHYYSDWNFNFSISHDGSVSLGVKAANQDNVQKTVKLSELTDPINVADIRAVRIWIDQYANEGAGDTWRVSINSTEVIWLQGTGKCADEITKECYWTGVQDFIGTVTITAFTSEGVD